MILNAVAVALAVLLPRRRALALPSMAALIAFVAGAAAILLTDRLTIAQAAAAFGAALALSILLARAANRAVLFLLLVLAAPQVPPQVAEWQRWAIGLALLAAAVALVKYADLGMRVACALLAAKVIAHGLPGVVPQWQVLAIAVALLAGATLVRSRAPPVQPRFSRVAGFGLAAFALGAAAVLAPFMLAPEVAASSRLARLAGSAPRGGLVWALPSEAILWDPPFSREQFPFVANLDSLWLGGSARVPFARLPGTTLSGRASLHKPIALLRAIKDEGEIRELRAAARATVDGLRATLPLLVPGARESAIERALLSAMRAGGCGAESFPLIVASGASAARAHGTGNTGTLRDGELVMLDLGCTSGHYASDFTRTLPVSGRFSERQRSLYEAVFAAQQAALKACKPGARLSGKGADTLDSIARAAIRARGLEDHNSFGIGHTVGLFVHDVGPSGPLQPGMVITIEPGLYIDNELGIRIEDTYAVTQTGCELLTTGFPANADAVEAQARRSAAPQ